MPPATVIAAPIFAQLALTMLEVFWVFFRESSTASVCFDADRKACSYRFESRSSWTLTFGSVAT
jgi:hypothetical protein